MTPDFINPQVLTGPAPFSPRGRGYFQWSALLILSTVFVHFLAFFPGIYTYDSADQLAQALTGQYYDWHPPLMAYLWSGMIQVTGHHESIFFFQLGLLTAGGLCWAKLIALGRRPATTLLIPLAFISPVFTNFAGTIWKDVEFAFAMLLAAGLAGLGTIEQKYSLAWTGLSIALLICSLGFRTNGGFALLPILVLCGHQFTHKRYAAHSSLQQSAATCTLSTLMLTLVIGFVFAISKFVIKPVNSYPFQYVELFDLAGISTLSKHDYFPDHIKQTPGYRLQDVAKEYERSTRQLGNADNLIFPNDNTSVSILPLNRDAMLQHQLHAAWLGAILKEPRHYIEHRLKIFQYLMNKRHYTYELPQDPVDRAKLLQKRQVHLSTPALQPLDLIGMSHAKAWVARSMKSVDGSAIFSGWLWLCLLLLELVASLILLEAGPVKHLALAVASSGILYTLPYFLVAPAADFRYLFWSTIAGTFAGIILIAEIDLGQYFSRKL